MVFERITVCQNVYLFCGHGRFVVTSIIYKWNVRLHPLINRILSFDTTASIPTLVLAKNNVFELKISLAEHCCGWRVAITSTSWYSKEGCSKSASAYRFPDIQIFRKLLSQWASIDKTPYTTMVDEECPVQCLLEEQWVKMVNYLQNVLKEGKSSKIRLQRAFTAFTPVPRRLDWKRL